MKLLRGRTGRESNVRSPRRFRTSERGQKPNARSGDVRETPRLMRHEAFMSHAATGRGRRASIRSGQSAFDPYNLFSEIR
jgi:hypothetical protein